MSELSIWIRDTADPCLPYKSTSHSWIAVIWSCGIKPLAFGDVRDGFFPLNVPGAARGRVHGQVKVPPGCYIVFAFSPCKNIFTDMTYVQVGCGETACVNLVTKRFSSCTYQLIKTIDIAAALGKHYKPGSEEKEIPRELLDHAKKALEKLLDFLPDDPVVNALKTTDRHLEKLAQEKE
ncbi:MAG TPA: hypothetical protein VMX35_05535 [Acidobacteriota bacterium]|nr:hypothetical protein [Acidobacteriota bacterium]